MTPEDLKLVETISENAAFRAANMVGDRLVAQIKSDTLALANSVRETTISEIEKTRILIESARAERHAEIDHHSDTCMVKKEFAEVKNRASGGIALLAALAGIIAGVAALVIQWWKH